MWKIQMSIKTYKKKCQYKTTENRVIFSIVFNELLFLRLLPQFLNA